MIGADAETTAWLFCVLNRPKAFQKFAVGVYDHLPLHAGGELTANELVVGPEQAKALLSIEVANLIDQQVLWRSPWLLPHARSSGLVDKSGTAIWSIEQTGLSSMLTQYKRHAYQSLIQTVNTIRSKHASNCLFADTVRANKLYQAQTLLSSTNDHPTPEVPLVASFAQSRQISIQQAAEMIVFKAQQEHACLFESELLKDEMTNQIDLASSVNTVAEIVAKIKSLALTMNTPA